MKLIVAIIRPEKLNDVLEALYLAEIRGLTVTGVQGHGGELEQVETYRGTTVKLGLHPKVRLEIGVSEPFVEPTVQIGLDLERAALHDRLARRVGAMVEAGLETEVRALAARGLREGRTASRALGYGQFLDVVDGRATVAEAVEEGVVEQMAHQAFHGVGTTLEVGSDVHPSLPLGLDTPLLGRNRSPRAAARCTAQEDAPREKAPRGVGPVGRRPGRQAIVGLTPRIRTARAAGPLYAERAPWTLTATTISYARPSRRGSARRPSSST